MELSRLRKTSTVLETQLQEFKADKNNIRLSLKTIQEDHQRERETHERELAKAKSSHAEEIDMLKAEIYDLKKEHDEEVNELKSTLTESEENHKTEIKRLKADIEQSEDDYEDDVMKVLDALQMAHEEDTQRRKPAENEEELKKRLEFLEKSYESEIAELKANLCPKCKKLVERRGLMSSPDFQRSMGSLSRSMGSRNLGFDV
uniref:Uncharacterized protein n=1 Tax=Pseudictyota dubia TaxID=2749911 RepID=A0A7R9WLR8_9STRA